MALARFFVAHLRLRFHYASESERVLKISLQDVHVSTWFSLILKRCLDESLFVWWEGHDWFDLARIWYAMQWNSRNERELGEKADAVVSVSKYKQALTPTTPDPEQIISTHALEAILKRYRNYSQFLNFFRDEIFVSNSSSRGISDQYRYYPSVSARIFPSTNIFDHTFFFNLNSQSCLKIHLNTYRRQYALHASSSPASPLQITAIIRFPRPPIPLPAP